MRISDWSSDVCSSDLVGPLLDRAELRHLARLAERSFQLGARAGALRLLDQVRLAGREAGGQQQQTRKSDKGSDDFHAAMRPRLKRRKPTLSGAPRRLQQGRPRREKAPPRWRGFREVDAINSGDGR